MNAAEAYGLQEHGRFRVVSVNHTQPRVVVNNIGPTEEIAQMGWRHRVDQLEGKEASHVTAVGDSAASLFGCRTQT